jgi:hypothetical protein
MNKKEALNFLAKYQPLPSDEELAQDENILEKYDEIRKYFIKEPDHRCIPLFLGSFGGGDGFGVYQLVEDVMWKFSKDEVLPHLIKALQSPSNDIKYWSIQIASGFPDDLLIPILFQILEGADYDLRSMAIIAITQIKSKEVRNKLSFLLNNEKDLFVREAIVEYLATDITQDEI